MVGKSHLCLTVCREKLLVGKEVSVGKDNVGRGRFNSGIGLSVGKHISVGKGLRRPDLQWQTRLVGKTHCRPPLRRRKQFSQPFCLWGIQCCGVVQHYWGWLYSLHFRPWWTLIHLTNVWQDTR
jgi:hypothetical protein